MYNKVYKTKTALQRLAEGNSTQDTPVKKNSKKKKKSKDNSNDDSDNAQKTGQQLLGIELSNGQTVLVDFAT